MSFLNVCDDSGVLSVILLAKNILDILSIIVPIILIIMLSVDVVKVVFGGDINKTIPKVTKSMISKCIAAVAIFFIPSIVNLFLSMLNQANYTAGACWENANPSSIAQFKAVEEANRLQEQEELGKEADEAKAERERVAKIREEARKENEEEAKKLEEEAKNVNDGGIMLGDVVYYNQCDYKAYKYGSYGTICSHGCGPTSCAVIASTFLGKDGHSPVDATNWICSHGGCTSSGTYAYKNAEYLKHLGLNVSKEYYWTADNVKLLMEKLSTGDYLAIILVRNKTGRAIFTKGGHFFVLTGVKNGEFTIAQVSKPAQNNQTWPISAFNGDAYDFYLVSKN